MEDILKIKKLSKLTWDDLAKNLPITGNALRVSFTRNSVDQVYLEQIRRDLKAQNVPKPDGKLINETEYPTKESGVPFYDIDFTAGFLEVENNQQTTPDSYINHPFFKGCDYVVRASGQSMAKVIKHGDAIGLIKLANWMNFIPNGEIYAIVTKDGHRLIKVVVNSIKNESLTLISKPSESKMDEFPPQDINKKDILAIYKVQATSHLF